MTGWSPSASSHYFFYCCAISDFMLREAKVGPETSPVEHVTLFNWLRVCVFLGLTGFVRLTGSWSCHLCLALLKDKASIYQQNQNSTSEWHQSQPPPLSRLISVELSALSRCSWITWQFSSNTPYCQGWEYRKGRAWEGSLPICLQSPVTCYENPLWTYIQ